MILALLWLTVSAPFVYASQQELAKQDISFGINNPHSSNDDDAANPFGNNTEEKAPTSNSSFSEEYLHDHHSSDYFFASSSAFHKGEDARAYIAFHGELLVPPPNLG